MSISQNGVKLLVSPRKGRVLFLFVLVAEFLLSALFVVSLGAHIIFPERARAAAGVSSVLSYQGRLTDSSGNALGDSGTNYCFRFSIYDDATVGAPDNKLWPAGAPSSMTVSVANGVFNVGVGDTGAGGDSLATYSFTSTSSVYLNVEVNDTPTTCSGGWDNLSPRQRLDSVAYARAAYELYGGNARVGTGSGVTTGNQKYLHLDQVTNSETIGGACPTNSVNGSVWYNSYHTRALVCENNIIKVLKTIGSGTTTVDAVSVTAANGNATFTSGTVNFAAGNNITLSSNAQAITIYGAGGGIGALAAGTQTATSGTMIFSNSNNVSFGMAGSQTITASAAFGGVAGSAASTVTNGVVQFSNLNGISFGLNGSTMSASYTPRPAIAASNTTYTTGTVVFTGNNNITVSYNAQTVSISGPNVHMVSLSGNNTAGVLANISTGTMYLAGGNNITLSQNGNSITISAGAGGGGFANYIAAGGVTTNGLNTINFSNANGVSFGLGAGANSSVMTASVNAGGGGLAAIGNTASSNAFTSGSIMFSGLANMTVNTSVNGVSQYIQLSAPNPGGGAAPTIMYWDNAIQTSLSSSATSNGTFWLFPLNFKAHGFLFPGNMTANTLALNMSVANASLSGAFSQSWRLGIYTNNASTLSLLNSVSTTFGNAAALAANTSLFSGQRFVTIHSSAWSAQPTFSQNTYYVGLVGHSAGLGVPFGFMMNRVFNSGVVRSGTMGVGMTSGNTTMGQIPFIGVSTVSRATNAALPTAIAINELVKTGALYGYIPHIQFNNISSNW